MISLLDILLLCRLVFRQVPQQALAAAQNVAVCPVKVIRIPRIFNVALPLGKVQQQMQLCLLLLHQIDQILFQSAKSHPVPFSFFLRLHIKYIRNITEQLANLKMLRTYLLALSALDTIRRLSVVPCMDPIIDI